VTVAHFVDEGACYEAIHIRPARSRAGSVNLERDAFSADLSTCLALPSPLVQSVHDCAGRVVELVVYASGASDHVGLVELINGLRRLELPIEGR
jgi:hypothetical protein